jgi:ATP/maltotriose-dependent transcriptional regulator MalT
MSAAVAAPGSAEPFVGRLRELQTFDECARGAREGRPWLLLVEGEPGIGKTALLRRFAGVLDGFIVLRAAGDPAEADFAYGLLSQLLPRLPAPARSASRLLQGELSPMEPPARVGAALLEALGRVQSAGPVALIVDDVQWVDRPSMRALAFALRRLYADRVLTVLAARVAKDEGPLIGGVDEGPWRSLIAGHEWIAEVRMTGLGNAEVAELAAQRGGDLAPEAAERLHAHTGGHPLYLRTLLADLPPSVLGRMDRPLPVPGSLTAAVRRQVDALPPSSQALLQALAVLDARVPLATAGALAEVADTASSLEPLISSGLVSWWPTEPPCPIRIKHVLLRDAVYAALPPVHRRHLHGRASDLVPVSAAWAHRVAAADRADPTLADELEAASTELMRQGQVLRGATFLQWASELSDSRAERERRLLISVAHLLCSLNIGAAAPLRPSAEACAPSALRTYVLGIYAVTRGAFAEAEGLLGGDLDAQASLPRDILAMTRASLSCSYMWQGRGDDSLREARRALSFGLRDHHVGAVAKGFAIIGCLLDQGPGAATPIFDEVGLPARAMDVVPIDAYALAYRGATHMLAGRLAEAQEDLTTAARLSQDGPIVEADVMSCFWLAQTEYLLGSWDQAVITAERAVANASMVEMPSTQAPTHAVASLVLSGRGDEERATQRMATAQQWMDLMGPAQYAVFTGMAAAAQAQARADFPTMFEALEPLTAMEVSTGWLRLYDAWWRPLFVESLIGTQQRRAAADALDQLAAVAARTPYLRLATAWLGGRLLMASGDDSRARTAFESGLAIPEGRGDVVILRAHLERAYGQFLLAQREAGPAGVALRRAHGRYVALGARPFADRVVSELSGLDPRVEDTAAQALPFTERERDIAHLVARGMTNQEVASQLFISAKTVEYHLGNIFARLGISSRRQLRGLLAQQLASTALA